jgi:hypothetical protein
MRERLQIGVTEPLEKGSLEVKDLDVKPKGKFPQKQSNSFEVEF